jgi:hypothetical protein
VLKLPRVYDIYIFIFFNLFIYLFIYFEATDPPENLATCSSFVQLTQAFIIWDAMWRALRKYIVCVCVCVWERERERDVKNPNPKLPTKSHHSVNTAKKEPEPFDVNIAN